MRSLALGAVAALVVGGSNAALAASDCLNSASRVVTIQGDQGYSQYRVGTKTGPDGTGYDASDATWYQEVYPAKKRAYPIVINGPDGGCWSGGTIIGTGDTNADWGTIYRNGNSAAIMWGHRASTQGFTVEGVRVHNVWDAFRPGNNADNFEIKNVWVTYNRDDCVENDSYNSGRVYNSLFDGCYVGFSSKNSHNTRDGSGKIWTIEKTLVRLEPMPGPKNSISTQGFFKLKQTGLKLRLIDNIFYVEQGANPNMKLNPLNDLVRLDIVRESRGNVIVWVGGGDYPWPVPAGFTVTTDESVWTHARSNWLEDHADQFGGSACGGLCS